MSGGTVSINAQTLSDRRWVNRIDALKLLIYNLADAYDVLIEILENKRLVVSSGNDSLASSLSFELFTVSFMQEDVYISLTALALTQ